MVDLSARLTMLSEADALLSRAVDNGRVQWVWAFNEMTDDQAEGLNRLFVAVTNLLSDADDGSKEGR